MDDRTDRTAQGGGGTLPAGPQTLGGGDPHHHRQRGHLARRRTEGSEALHIFHLKQDNLVLVAHFLGAAGVCRLAGCAQLCRRVMEQDGGGTGIWPAFCQELCQGRFLSPSPFVDRAPFAHPTEGFTWKRAYVHCRADASRLVLRSAVELATMAFAFRFKEQAGEYVPGPTNSPC